jgi:hypothetical protein
MFGMKLSVFRTVPLSIIRSFSLYTQQWYMPYRFADIYHCCVYSEKLLMVDRGTVGLSTVRSENTSCTIPGLGVYTGHAQQSTKLWKVIFT